MYPFVSIESRLSWLPSNVLKGYEAQTMQGCTLDRLVQSLQSPREVSIVFHLAPLIIQHPLPNYGKLLLLYTFLQRSSCVYAINKNKMLEC